MRSLQARSYSNLSVEPLVLPDKLAGVGGRKLRPDVVCPPIVYACSFYLRSFDELDEATVFTYDASGNQLSVRDPNNVGEDVVYDALGRAGLRTDTNSDTTNSGYDDAGNRISATDGKSNTTSYSYDARGRQVKQTDRLSGETEFAYTATGQLASLTDAEDQTTSYAYDDAGNKLTETYPDHVTSSTVGQTGYGIISFTYDPAGRVDVRTDQQGDTCTYDYDLAGRLTSRDYRNVGVQALADSDSFTYDAASRMLTAVSGRYANTVTYTYDSAGRKATEALTISGQTYTTTISYNAAGQLTGYTYPDGTAVGRSYTDRGQLYQLTHASSTIDTWTFHDGGRMTGSNCGNGVSESRSYSTRKKNTLASISFSGASIGTYAYGWDDNKNKTSESITGTMSGYGFTVGSSGYDTEDRLVNWERSDTNLDQSWNLSLVGDWTSYIENSATQNRTHGPTHELLSAGGQSLSHDTKGNMTLIPAVLRDGTNSLTLNWDFENKLTTADVGSDTTIDVTYKWDALGRRVYRDDGTSPRVFVQVGQQTIADYGAGIAASTPKYRYVYASYIDEPVLRYEPSATETLYYHRNQQYSIIALTDGSCAIEERYAYSAYGEPVFVNATGTVLSDSAKDNRYTYTGREWGEAISLYHFRARMYGTESGRFCGRDPIRYSDGTNSYLFFSGSPSVYFDPTGLRCLGPFLDGAQINDNTEIHRSWEMDVPSVLRLRNSFGATLAKLYHNDNYIQLELSNTHITVKNFVDFDLWEDFVFWGSSVNLAKSSSRTCDISCSNSTIHSGEVCTAIAICPPTPDFKKTSASFGGFGLMNTLEVAAFTYAVAASPSGPSTSVSWSSGWSLSVNSNVELTIVSNSAELTFKNGGNQILDFEKSGGSSWHCDCGN